MPGLHPSARAEGSLRRKIGEPAKCVNTMRALTKQRKDRFMASVIKTCSACKQALPIELFGVASSYADGRRGQCNPCRSRHQSTYVKTHPQKRHKQSIESVRKSKLKTKYGMTPDGYQALLASQGGLCAICKTSEPGGRWGCMHVDHCHTTGVIRGLLCHNCNVALGRVGDNMQGVMRFVNYLAGVPSRQDG